MKTKHTIEPWHLGSDLRIMSKDGFAVAHCACWSRLREELLANQRRIVACVNACAGMTDQQVSHGLVSSSLFSEVQNQRDDALKALQALSDLYPEIDYMEASDDYSVTEIDWVRNARAVISSISGWW